MKSYGYVKESTAVMAFIIGWGIGIFFGLYLSHLKPDSNSADNRSSLQAECERYGGC